MNPFVKIVLRHGLPVLVIAAALVAAYFHGAATTADEYEARLAQQAERYALATADALKKARHQEQAATAYVATIDRAHQEALKNEITSRDRTIADLRAGSVQLRQRFTCPAASNSLPGAAHAPSSSDAATRGGLREEDAAFLVRLASEADQVTLQLQACQAIVSNGNTSAGANAARQGAR